MNRLTLYVIKVRQTGLYGLQIIITNNKTNKTLAAK